MALGNTKLIAIIAVAIVAIAGIGVGVYFLTKDNGSSEKDALEIAEKYRDDYNGVFGQFKIEDGATSEKAVINATVEKYLNDKGQNQVNRITIYKFDSADKAEEKYKELLAVFPTKVSMYTTLETIELADDSAKEYNVDKGKLMINTYEGSSKGGKDPTKTAASQICGLVISGKVVIDFSQTVGKDADAGENVRLYYGLPITDKYEASQQISLDTAKGYVKEFLAIL